MPRHHLLFTLSLSYETKGKKSLCIAAIVFL